MNKKNKINLEKVIEKIKKNKIKLKKIGVKKIGIFGSFLYKTNKENSDVDILVSFKEISFRNYITLLRYLEKLLCKKVDLVIESDLKPELNYVLEEAEYVKI